MSDVWDSAANAKAGPTTYYGQIFTDAFYCTLQKGIGKVPFDPQADPADRKLTCIKIDGIPFTRSGKSFTIQRELIAEFRDWAGIVLPSLKVCNVHPRELNEKWAEWEMVETGRTWEDKVSGEERKATTFKFLRVFGSEAECRGAWEARFGTNGDEDEDEPLPMPEASNPVGNGNPEKAVAAKFLPALFAQSGGDVGEMGKLLAGNPLTSKFFDLNSPEVVELFTPVPA